MAREATIKTKLVLEGEKEYKSAISGANQELKTLKSELAATTSAMGKNGSEQKKAVATVKNLNQQIDVQKKKVDTLKKAVEESTKKFGENGKTTLEYRQKLADATTELNKMTQAQKDAKEAASQLDDALKNPFDNLVGGLPDALGSALDTIGDKFDQFAVAAGAAFAGVLATVTSTAKQIADLENETAQYADDLLTQSATSGIDTDTLQEWMYASNFMDVSVDSMLGAVSKLRKGMTSGNKDLEKLFRQLGVRTKDGSKDFRDAIDVFWDLVDVLHDADSTMNETTQANIMQQLFGNNYADLLPLIQGGRQMWEGYGQQAKDNAFVLDADTVALYGQINDHLDGIKAASAAIRRSVAGIFAHNYEKLTGDVEILAKSFNKWLNGDEDTDTLVANIEQLYSDAEAAAQNGLDSLLGLAGRLQESDNQALVSAGEAIEDVVTGFQWIMDNKDNILTAMGFIAGAFTAIKIAEFITNLDPLTIAIAGIVTLVTTIVTHWEDIVKSIEDAIEKMQIFLGLKDGTGAAGSKNPRPTDTYTYLDDLGVWVNDRTHETTIWQPEQQPDWAAYVRGDHGGGYHFGEPPVDVPPVDVPVEAQDDALDEVMQQIQEATETEPIELEFKANGVLTPESQDVLQAALEEMGLNTQVAVSISQMSRTNMMETLRGMGLTVPVLGVLTGVDDSALTAGNGIPGFASGIDYVPRDNMLAFLHKGETVLPAPEAAAYRNGGGMSGMNIANVLASVLSNVRVQIDGESAGRLLAPTVSHYIVAEGI